MFSGSDSKRRRLLMDKITIILEPKHWTRLPLMWHLINTAKDAYGEEIYEEVMDKVTECESRGEVIAVAEEYFNIDWKNSAFQKDGTFGSI